jgi:hypothetical protein
MPIVFYALAFYFLVALLLTYPLFLSFGRAVSDPVDPILNMWILAWEHHTLLTQPLELLNANIFYPYTQTLLYSETLLLPSLILLPVSVAIDNPIVIHNLFVLMGLATTGASGYLLGRWLFRNHWAGVMLGGVLAFNSYTLSNVAQAQLLHLEWMPLVLLYLGKLLQRPRLRFSLLLAFFLAAQFYTVIYYGLFGFVVVGLVGGMGWLLISLPVPEARWRALGLLAGSVAFALLLCLPLAIPYYQLSLEYGFARTLADVWPFSASLEMWMTAPEQNLLYGGVVGEELPKLGFYAVDALFPGIFLLLMAVSGLLLWFWHALRGRQSSNSIVGTGAFRYPLFLLQGIALFFLLSLGPYPQVKSLHPDFDQLLPYAWLHQWVPGFQALRAPGRFAAMVFLGLGIASAYLLAHLRWRAVQISFLVLLLVEALSVPTTALYTPTLDPDQRVAYAWLAAQPETVYLELPVYAFGQEGEEDHWLESQFGSMVHWQKMLVGYSGFFPSRYDDLLFFVSLFPKVEVVHFLQALGVEWVLLHRDRLPATKWPAIGAAIQEQGWETKQWRDVWAVRLPAGEAAQPELSYFIPDRAQADGVLTLAAILTSDSPTPILPNSELGHVRAEWWQGERRVLVAELTYQPPFYVDSVAVATLAIPVPELEGDYALQLYAAQSDQPLASANVSVMADVASPEVTLVPLLGVEAMIACDAGEAQLQIAMRTIGWYDEPFTLSARVLDESSTELARSAADVEFPAQRPRSNLLTTHLYDLPLTDVPASDVRSLNVDLIAYRWQQEAERIVPRHFVLEDGSVVGTLRLPLTHSSTCEFE